MLDIKSTLDNLLQEIVGKVDGESRIIKINKKNLCETGDLCFPLNLLAWKNIIKYNEIQSVSRNILEHYLKRRNVDTAGCSYEDVEEKALKFLIATSKSWTLPVKTALIQKEQVCLFLDRSCIITAVIKAAIESNGKCGKELKTKKSVYLKINQDKESELTTWRLRKLKTACENILKLHGYDTNNDAPDYKYCLTTKSQGYLDDEGCKKYVCGVVKNPETNVKETKLNCKMYLQRKMSELAVMNESRLSDSSVNPEWLETIAEVIVTFEFLSVKPSQSLFIKAIGDIDEKVSNNKGGIFVLYNAARITSILEKFNKEQLSGNYPGLWDIGSIDFGKLSSENEWSLVFNFILGYPNVLMKCVQGDISHEFHTHMLCSFLFNLCQRFSIYYRHCRILTQGRENLISTMMARIYLLEALKIVVDNCLAILNIVPISRM